MRVERIKNDSAEQDFASVLRLFAMGFYHAVARSEHDYIISLDIDLWRFTPKRPKNRHNSAMYHLCLLALAEQVILLHLQVDQLELGRPLPWHLTRMAARWPSWVAGKSAWMLW